MHPLPRSMGRSLKPLGPHFIKCWLRLGSKVVLVTEGAERRTNGQRESAFPARRSPSLVFALRNFTQRTGVGLLLTVGVKVAGT